MSANIGDFQTIHRTCTPQQFRPTMKRANLARYGTHEARLELGFLVASSPEAVTTHHPFTLIFGT
jgi:hypothetical protein